MPQIDVDDATFRALRIAANAAAVPVGEIVARALAALAEASLPPPADPWIEVDVYVEYLGERVDGRFLPATRRLVITSGPLAGQSFRTPSAAAGAVVASRSDRTDPRTNGWRFWHVARTGEYLEAVRAPRSPGRRRDALR